MLDFAPDQTADDLMNMINDGNSANDPEGGDEDNQDFDDLTGQRASLSHQDKQQLPTKQYIPYNMRKQLQTD
jgi:hypothetical protein